MRGEGIGRFAAAAMALVLLGGGPGLAAAAALERAALQCDRGFTALGNGEIERARAAFEKAAKLAPAYPEAHVGLGHVAMRESRYDDALAEYQAARDGYGQLADALFEIENKRYAEVQQTLPRLQVQLAQLQSGQTKIPESELRWTIAATQEKIRDLEMVQPPQKDRMAEPPGRIDFYLGNALCRLGRWEEAVAVYETCLTKMPGFGEAWNNLALAYWKADRHRDALGALQEAEGLGFEVNPSFKADLERSYQRKRAASASEDEP